MDCKLFIDGLICPSEVIGVNDSSCQGVHLETSNYFSLGAHHQFDQSIPFNTNPIT